MPRKKKSNLSRNSKNARRKRLSKSLMENEESETESEDDVRSGSSESRIRKKARPNSPVPGVPQTADSVNPGPSNEHREKCIEQEQPSTSRDRVALFRVRQSQEEKEKQLVRDKEWHTNHRFMQSNEDRDSRLSKDKDRHATSRGKESMEEAEFRREQNRVRQLERKQQETVDETNTRREDDRIRQMEHRLQETVDETETRRQENRIRQMERRLQETEDETNTRREEDRIRQMERRQQETVDETDTRREENRIRQMERRLQETEDELETRREEDRIRRMERRQQETVDETETRREENRIRQMERRLLETVDEIIIRREEDRIRHNERYQQLVEQRDLNLNDEIERVEEYRAHQDDEERHLRFANDNQRHHMTRQVETDRERQVRLAEERRRHLQRHHMRWMNKNLSGFLYDPQIHYAEAANIGALEKVCIYCHALTWAKESSGICCASGKVVIPPIVEAPEPLRLLLSEDTPQSRSFQHNIRAYNSAFQMTSFGGNEVRESGYMPTFKVQGQVYHLIGSLLPTPGQPASFLQIYFMGDSQAQLERRLNLFQDLDADILAVLQNMLQNHNTYIDRFKTAMETLPPDTPEFKIVIRADKHPADQHPGRFNEPTRNEVAILMVGEPSDRRDIVLNSREEGLKRIFETHRSYDALQYPLMFCRGEDGYHFDIHHVNPTTRLPSSKKTSSREFYAFRIMVREGDPNHIHSFKQLLNQYLVDMYAKVESERLLYLRTHQKELRAENYVHLQDALGREDSVEQMGQKIILPSTFTGGPRYMHSRTQDAFCYVRKFGRPDLFLTITTNPKWPEITSVIGERQSAEDRYDIVSRVFHLKLKCLMELLTKGQIFGTVRCFMYSVEWQKRGLPHAHILIWLEEPIPPNRVDEIICAEIPNSEVDPELFNIVKTHMLHGPCGVFSVRQRKFPCVKNGQCSKRYPRQFVDETITGENGYPTYRRRAPENGGHEVLIAVGNEQVFVDNRWVVPYSPVLSRTFETHINVEYCSSVKSIKYICKYINKGTDQATFSMSKELDEIQIYQSGRYICTSEAVWRLLSFPIHERFPAVSHLEVHLPDEQRIYFQPENVREQMERKTTLLAFFDLCQTDGFARTLFYNEVPSFYTYSRQRGWSRRLRGKSVEGHPNIRKDSCIGRVYSVHPSSSERYYLRMLLHHVRGPTSFSDLKTVDGEEHPTFQSACRELGLLEDDSCWEETLREAVVSESPHKLRDLFCVLLVFCNLSNPLDMWMRFRDSMAEDFLVLAQQLNNNATFENSPNLYDMCLTKLQETITHIGGLRLDSYNLPLPVIPVGDLNIDYIRETSYNSTQLRSFVQDNYPKLNTEQKEVYHSVLSSVNHLTNPNIFFLDAPGGTGKTFLINLILAQVRGEQQIALAVASSGIAATLLPGGRTAHSMFKIPINVDHTEFPVCSISKNSPMAQVIQECSLIVWDECTMAHKLATEALDRTLKDIRNSPNTMGGVTVLFSGDFRQTLPVVVRGTRADEVNASLKRSTLWPCIKRVSLSLNMRVIHGIEQGAEEFPEILLKVGNGTLENTNGIISIPPSLAVVVGTQEQLITSVFPGIVDLLTIDNAWLCDRAILTPKNEQAAEVNRKVLSLFVSEERTYKSINTVLREDDAVNYPAEFLESITAPGLPAHELTLKVGAPVMLLRNLHPPKLCNGTRLRVRRLQRYVIEADILTGCGVGEVVLIPRIPLIPSNYPFEFKRLQFPLAVCFAMTINKSQGQTLSTAGVDLSGSGCFSHGQLYVACSRVRSSRSLFIYAPEGQTANIVYEEALR